MNESKLMDEKLDNYYLYKRENFIKCNNLCI